MLFWHWRTFVVSVNQLIPELVYIARLIYHRLKELGYDMRELPPAPWPASVRIDALDFIKLFRPHAPAPFEPSVQSAVATVHSPEPIKRSAVITPESLLRKGGDKFDRGMLGSDFNAGSGFNAGGADSRGGVGDDFSSVVCTYDDPGGSIGGNSDDELKCSDGVRGPKHCWPSGLHGHFGDGGEGGDGGVDSGSDGDDDGEASACHATDDYGFDIRARVFGGGGSSGSISGGSTGRCGSGSSAGSVSGGRGSMGAQALLPSNLRTLVVSPRSALGLGLG